ncbi:MAG: hypothetical protein LBV79_07890 [Candidatus Adiutrix sp.]|jgi:hypothetical protein|nr:hypothetical protein [Candidatus Adiutrix sp.]
MHPYTSCFRLAAALFLAALPLTGCGSDEPSADHVALTLESAFARNQAVEIDDVEPEWIETGEARLEGKTSLTLRLKEDAYLSADLSEALAALKIESAETGLLRQARATAEAQAEPLRSALLEKAPPSLEQQRFIKPAAEKGDEFAAEATIRAQKSANGWDLEILNIAQTRAPEGRPRSALPAEALVVGSAEAKQAVQDGLEAIRKYAAEVDAAAAEAAKSLTEAKARKRAELLAGLTPGTVYLGTLERPDKSIGESGLVIEEAEAATGVIKGYAFNDDPRKKNPFMGTIREGATPLLFNISTDQPGMMVAAELDLTDGRLTGTLTVTEQDSSGRQTYRNTSGQLTVSWGAADQKALEAKIAAMTARDEAQKKRQDEYQAALAATIAPGQAFQGVWTYDDRRGEIGLYIETVATNGLSCAGYLFDPTDRFLRKTFTATVNREFEAESPLTVTAASGQGLPYSDQLTDTQKSWLRDDSSYSLPLSLKDSGWSGQTSGRYAVTLAPVPDFAALLAQDQATAAAYQAAMAKAAAPGQAFQGVWTYNDRRGEIALYIETCAANGLICEGYLFDPVDRSKRKPFTAAVNKDFKAPTALIATTVRGKGIANSSQLTESQKTWLLTDIDDAIHLNLKNGGWTGQSEGYAVELTPIPDFADLLAQDQATADAYQAALTAATAPGQAFQGVWTYKDQRGEIGLYIETAAADGLVCEGYLFDPADRSKRKPFTAAVNKEFQAEAALTATLRYDQGVPDSDQLTLSQRAWLRDNLNGYSITLALKDGGWTGQSRDYAVKFAPLPDFADLLAQDQAAEQQRREAEKAAVLPNAEYTATWRWGSDAGDMGLKILTLSDSGVNFTAVLFDPADPATVWQYNGTVTKDNEGRAVFTLTPVGTRNNTKPESRTHYLLNDKQSDYQTVSLKVTAEGLSGRLFYQGPQIAFKKITTAPATTAANPVAPAPAAATQAAEAPAATPATAPKAPAPAAATAPATAAPAAPATATSYPPLVLASNGKPKIAAHRVSQEGKAVALALQALAHGKQLTAVRIDNLGGVQAHFRSDGLEGAAPLTVSLGGKSSAPGAASLDIAAGEAEILLTLSLEDNGAFAGGATEFRVTVFFADGERAMCFLK